ncbi:adenosylcobinamide-phosphate synthase CbiB [Pelotomaculum propionicicum]|uniref:adenosylcobinamide-phosphate synthase CbiB n=1 Tax=Pelotomaculum propionicicum TaxID=258475 RepID=UPI003B772C1E
MLENIGLFVLLAFLLDLLVGDPAWIPHPVVLIGKAIEIMERLFRRVSQNPAALKITGLLTAIIIVGASWGLTCLLARWAFSINYWAGAILSIWLISTTIAARGLSRAAGEIYILLQNENLAEARRKVGMIVGRDTSQMEPGSVIRASVETVAENIVDGVVAPLFYAFIGGAPLAMAYRAVNTLDSMLGYKNERYINFGMASARLDDIANYIPARLTGLFLPAAAWILRMSAKGALQAVLRDASGHPSPNSGIPEAAVAGALGVRLGGMNYYNGRGSFRAYMGKPLTPLAPDHIKQTVKLMYLSSSIAVFTGLLVFFFARRLF